MCLAEWDGIVSVLATSIAVWLRCPGINRTSVKSLLSKTRVEAGPSIWKQRKAGRRTVAAFEDVASWQYCRA